MEGGRMGNWKVNYKERIALREKYEGWLAEATGPLMRFGPFVAPEDYLKRFEGKTLPLKAPLTAFIGKVHYPDIVKAELNVKEIWL